MSDKEWCVLHGVSPLDLKAANLLAKTVVRMITEYIRQAAERAKEKAK